MYPSVYSIPSRPPFSAWPQTCLFPLSLSPCIDLHSGRLGSPYRLLTHLLIDLYVGQDYTPSQHDRVLQMIQLESIELASPWAGSRRQPVYTSRPYRTTLAVTLCVSGALLYLYSLRVSQLPECAVRLGVSSGAGTPCNDVWGLFTY